MGLSVILVDDHTMLRQGIRRALESEGIKVVAEASDGAEAIRLALEHKPDVVLMDVSMPGMDGVEAARRLVEADGRQRVVMLTMHIDRDVIDRAIRAGAVGYLTKDSSISEVILAIQLAANGDRPMSPRLAAAMLDEARREDALISAREEEVLQLVADGFGTNEIAERLYISGKTVKNHLASIYEKLERPRPHPGRADGRQDGHRQADVGNAGRDVGQSSDEWRRLRQAARPRQPRPLLPPLRAPRLGGIGGGRRCLHRGLGLATRRVGVVLVVLGPCGLALGVVAAGGPVAVLVDLEVLAVLLGQLATLGGLLDRQADAAAGEVEIDDLDPQLLAGRDDLLGRVDVVRRHLGDVHETLDAVADLHEPTERHELGDPAVDQLADLVGAGELLPRILLGGLQRQADALAVEVDVEHLHGDLVADGDDGTRVVDVLPRQLADVDETVHAAEVDERTEADRRCDTTPSRTSPGLRLVRKLSRLSFCVSSRKARRLSTTLLRFLSSSMILACTVLPTYGARSRTRRSSTSDAGRKPRRPMSTMRPPLTTSITGPSTMPSASLIFSIVPHARSYCARFLDRSRRPSLSSFVRTSASIFSPS